MAYLGIDCNTLLPKSHELFPSHIQFYRKQIQRTTRLAVWVNGFPESLRDRSAVPKAFGIKQKSVYNSTIIYHNKEE